MFLNSIKALKALAHTMTLLELPVFALHAHMQQRQRLKSLDRFRASTRAFLVVRAPAAAAAAAAATAAAAAAVAAD